MIGRAKEFSADKTITENNFSAAAPNCVIGTAETLPFLQTPTTEHRERCHQPFAMPDSGSKCDSKPDTPDLLHKNSEILCEADMLEANITKEKTQIKYKKQTPHTYNQLENIKKYNTNMDKHIKLVRWKQIKIDDNNIYPLKTWNETLLKYQHLAEQQNEELKNTLLYSLIQNKRIQIRDNYIDTFLISS